MTVDRERNLVSTIALSWAVLASILMMMTLSEIVQAAIRTDFTEFVHHPGPEIWAISCVLFTVYVMMSILVRLYSASWFRWLNVALLIYVTGFALVHQIVHMIQGKEYGIYGVVDVGHHVVGTIAIVLAVRLARRK